MIKHLDRRTALGAAAMVFAATVAGVGALGGSAGATGTAPRASSGSGTVTALTAAPSAACGTDHTTGESTLNVAAGGHDRTVIVYVPPSYTGKSAVPLILNLHGSGSDGAQQVTFSGMDTTADQDGFIVAYPQGDIPEGTGYDWNVPGVPLVGGAAVPAGAANDVTFLTDLVYTLESRYCVERNHVDATGMSGGGRMSSQLGCDEPGVFAAVAPVAGLRFPSPCSTSAAAAVIAFHGSGDPVDPYNGNGQKYWTYSVPVAAQRWAAYEHCVTTPKTTTPASGATLYAYTGCSGGSVVELYRLTGEGHEWPGGPHMPLLITAALGPQFPGLSANNVMVAFFEAHPLH